LAAWKQRPACLTPMAYQWCSVLSGHGWRDPTPAELYILHLRPRDPFETFENRSAGVGPHRARGDRGILGYNDYKDLLSTMFEIGFRLARLGHGQPAIRLDHTSHHSRMFEVAFSSNDDEVIADAVRTWIVNSDCTPAGLLVGYFSERVESTRPFSPRLRQMVIRAICRTRSSELIMSALETVRLLDRIEPDVDDVEDERGWINLLVGVIRSPVGFNNLSHHYWRLLGELTLTMHAAVGPDRVDVRDHGGHAVAVRDMEVMRSLEEAEDLEKLEVWMGILWLLLWPTFLGPGLVSNVPTPEPMECIEQATLKLSLRQPSALQRFERLHSMYGHTKSLRRICKRARAERLSSELPLPPYVSDPPTQLLSPLTPFFFLLQSTDSRQATNSPSFLGRRHLLRVSVVYTTADVQGVGVCVCAFGMYRVIVYNINLVRSSTRDLSLKVHGFKNLLWLSSLGFSDASTVLLASCSC